MTASAMYGLDGARLYGLGNLPAGRLPMSPGPFALPEENVSLAARSAPPASAGGRSEFSIVQEAHHRIKNSLQLVASMLSLQARQSDDPVLSASLLEAARRVTTVARTHQRLQDGGQEPIDVRPFLQALCDDFAHGAGCEARGVVLKLEAEPEWLSPCVAETLGLIFNELAANALKHAYVDRGGRIKVRFERSSQGHRLTVADEGSGFQAEGGGGLGLGLTLVGLFAKKLQGRLLIERRPDGSAFTVCFP